MKTRRRGDHVKKTPQTFSSSELTPEFFKVFLPHFSAYQLHIPRAFIYQFKETIQKKLILKDIDGRLWDVEVNTNGEGFFITKGWENFVMNHALFSGDFLVFRYDGNACFTVKIFGINGCKKEVSSLVSKIKIENETDEVKAKQSCHEAETNYMELNQETPENGLMKVTQSRLLRSSSRMDQRSSPGTDTELCKTEMDSEKKVTQSRMTRRRSHPYKDTGLAEPEIDLTGAKKKKGTQSKLVQSSSRMATRRRPCTDTELAKPEPPGISRTKIDLTGGDVAPPTLYVAPPLGTEEVTPSRLVQSSSRMATRRRPHTDTKLAETKGTSRTEIDLTGTEETEEVTESRLLGTENVRQSRLLQTTTSRMGTRRRPRKDTGLAESEVPYFIASVDSLCMDTMPIPETIVKTFNVKLNRKMFLCYHKKRWPVAVNKEGDGRVTFGNGWMTFWKENNLSVGQRCMFKFATTRSSDEIEVRVL